MNTTIATNPRPPRKISYKEQQSVDEILQLVQDQTRKISLSEADYRTQKRLERSASLIEDDSDFFDDSSYGTSASSEISSSPPSTQETMLSQISWDSGHRPRSLSNGDSTSRRSLPPLDPLKSKIHPRPPARLTMHESFDDDTQVKRVRPMSARGQRTNGRTRGLTT